MWSIREGIAEALKRDGFTYKVSDSSFVLVVLMHSVFIFIRKLCLPHKLATTIYGSMGFYGRNFRGYASENASDIRPYKFAGPCKT